MISKTSVMSVIFNLYFFDHSSIEISCSFTIYKIVAGSFIQELNQTKNYVIYIFAFLLAFDWKKSVII